MAATAEERSDDTALLQALAAVVVLKPSDLPACQWAQPVPCQNPGLLRTQDGTLTLCLDHYNRYHG